MAVTRAKARALRDAVNIGVVAIEELKLEFGNGAGNPRARSGSPSNGRPPSNGKQTPQHAPTSGEQRSLNGPTNGRREPQQNGRPGNGSGSGNDPMTENQRRFLFRILAEHGVTGDVAHDYLVRIFRTGSLKEVTKREASELIEELLANARELLAGVAVS